MKSWFRNEKVLKNKKEKEKLERHTKEGRLTYLFPFFFEIFDEYGDFFDDEHLQVFRYDFMLASQVCHFV